ncbi:MAG TPA: hypothetical protein VFZ23_00990, partial [Pyrinomonadaceae bacterium]
MKIRIVAILTLVFFVAGFQCPCTPCPDPYLPFDFDDDEKADLSIYRPSSGDWWILNSSTGQSTFHRFGLPGDIIVPADYTGDYKTDIAVFRSGVWHVLRSDNYTHYQALFGLPGDIPVPADFGTPFPDIKADLAVYRPSEGVWYITTGTGAVQIIRFGSSEDQPVAADYDGDKRANIALFRPSTGRWYILGYNMTDVTVREWGMSTDKVVPSDYTGDKKA